LLADRQPAEVQQVANQHHGLGRPWFRLEARGPHWQRPRTMPQSIVHPIAIGGQLLPRFFVQIAHFTV
jgi:hypothetical protein